MKISKISLVILLLVVVLTSCKKEVEITNTNQKIEVKTTGLDYDCLKSRAIKSITHSCGGGCAITYNERKISIDDSSIKVEYDGIVYINERIEEKFTGSFHVKCNSQNKADFVYYKDEPNDNILDVKVNSISESFQKYSDELCSCLKQEKEAITSSIKDKISCIKESGISLPYNKRIDINSVNYTILDCNIIGVSDWLCGHENLRYLPLFKNKNINAILIPMDCGDSPYRYYLLTIYDNEIVSSLYVEGILSEPENLDNLETTSFEIDENYIIKVKTENVNGEQGLIETKKYKITEDGTINEID